MSKLKLMTIVGTRPEIIRLSAVIKKCDVYFDQLLVHTGQNYDYTLNQIFFEDLGLRAPDHYLDAVGDVYKRQGYSRGSCAINSGPSAHGYSFNSPTTPCVVTNCPASRYAFMTIQPPAVFFGWLKRAALFNDDPQQLCQPARLQRCDACAAQFGSLQRDALDIAGGKAVPRKRRVQKLRACKAALFECERGAPPDVYKRQGYSPLFLP